MAVMTTYPSRSSAVGSQIRRFFNFRCSTQMSNDLVTGGNAGVENPAGQWFDAMQTFFGAAHRLLGLWSSIAFPWGSMFFALSFSWAFLPFASDSSTSSISRPTVDLTCPLTFWTLAWVARLCALILLLHVLFYLSISPLVRLLSHHSKGSPIDSPSFLVKLYLALSVLCSLSLGSFPRKSPWCSCLLVCLVVSISHHLALRCTPDPRRSVHPLSNMLCDTKEQ